MRAASQRPSCIFVGFFPFPSQGFVNGMSGKILMAARMDVALVSSFDALYVLSAVVWISFCYVFGGTSSSDTFVLV